MFGLKEKGADAVKQRMLQQIEPREHPAFNSIATILTGIEHDQARAVKRLTDAADVDLDVNHQPEARREQLLDVAESLGNNDLASLWFEDVLDVDQADMIQNYIGLSGDEWREQLETWYRQYREMGIVDDPIEEADRADIGHVAQLHVSEAFGMDLNEFVAGVINWDKGAVLEEMLVGPTRDYTRTIHLVADELKDDVDQEDVDEP